MAPLSLASAEPLGEKIWAKGQGSSAQTCFQRCPVRGARPGGEGQCDQLGSWGSFIQSFLSFVLRSALPPFITFAAPSSPLQPLLEEGSRETCCPITIPF